MRIDGLIILELTETELQEELKIVTNLHRKKILKAIEVLKEYHEHLKDHGITDVRSFASVTLIDKKNPPLTNWITVVD